VECELVQVGISQRMDGAALSEHVLEALDVHTATCRTCTEFSRRAERVRAAVRIHEAEPVPDLVAPIMAAVAVERDRRSSIDTAVRAGAAPAESVADRADELRVAQGATRPGDGRPTRDRRWKAARSASIAAAVIVGLVLGSVLVGGPLPSDRSRSPQPAAQAAGVGREVLRHAVRIGGVQARFAIAERNYAPDVPIRRFDMRVWLSPPERFRLEIRDQSAYPRGSAYARNNLSYIVDGAASYASGPTACPRGLAGTCPRRSTIVSNRPPFSSDSPIPSDVVLPITTLGGLQGIHAQPGGRILGRDTETVQIPYERAAPLFPFLRLPTLDLGEDAWRPYYAKDRVIVSLDEQTLLPLRMEVWAASGDRSLTADRKAWQLRFGMQPDPTKRPLLSVTATSFGPLTAQGHPFEIPRLSPSAGDAAARQRIDEGARSISLARAARRMRLPLEATARASGLAPYRAATTVSDESRQTILAYASGVSWLKIAETDDWSRGALYGVDPQSEEVAIQGAGVGYFEPGSDWSGRRLAIHTQSSDVLLETNLPRADLLRVASALGLAGRPIPEAWSVQRAGGVVSRRVSLSAAAREVPFPVRLPADGSLPPGYTVASTELTSTRQSVGVTVFYRQVDSDLGGSPIRIHEEPGTRLAPAMLPNERGVRIAGEVARYDPSLRRLQWIRGGVYYAIDSPGMELPDLAALARSLRPVAAAS
jgi:hypothetical protein